MPSYFYHLIFELYPYPSSISANRSIKGSRALSKEEAREEGREFWIPPVGGDIFDCRWPEHRVERDGVGLGGWGLIGPGKLDSARRSEGVPVTGRGEDIVSGTVIDCGVERGEIEDLDLGSRHKYKAFGGVEKVAIPAVGDITAAEKDWRFGRVRIEGFDLSRNMAMDSHSGSGGGEMGNTGVRRGRGESSGAGGINAGLTAAAAAVGRVTKARFEEIGNGGRNTELGWGVVHLYRDGEETLSLASAAKPVDLYSAETGGKGEKVDGKSTLGGGDEEEDCTTLCIPAVPSYLTPSDFLGFVGEKTREQVSHFRMVMTGRMNRYLVLMKFRDGNVAKNWRKAFDGKVFNSMEPETCHVVFIKSITFHTPDSSHPNASYPELSHDPFMPASPASTFSKPYPPPTPNLVELPTCPVCLERMDDTTGLLTIPCQHVFHCDCLQKWRGSGCPVCRHTNPSLSLSLSSNSNPNNTYDPNNPPFGSGEASLCSICDCTDDLWICLICGNVGCGRYKGGHAKEHWKDSAHNFALEIETQHVWDYAGDLWVHRLIRGKGDSKVIELPSDRRRGGGGGEEEDMIPRAKFESMSMEYTHLLTSQLDSQRVYFEDLVSKAVAKASSANSAATSAVTKAEEALSRLKVLEDENERFKKDVIPNLEKELEREKRRGERSTEVARGMGKSLLEEKKVSEGLLERVGFVNGVLEGVRGELEGLKRENEELKESNRDLMFCLSAGDKLKEMGEGEGGSVVVPVEKEKEKKGRGKGKGKA